LFLEELTISSLEISYVELYSTDDDPTLVLEFNELPAFEVSKFYVLTPQQLKITAGTPF
jgi:hypothetical protein